MIKPGRGTESDLEELEIIFKGIASELELDAGQGVFLGGRYFKPRWWFCSDPESLNGWDDCKYFRCRGDRRDQSKYMPNDKDSKQWYAGQCRTTGSWL